MLRTRRVLMVAIALTFLATLTFWQNTGANAQNAKKQLALRKRPWIEPQPSPTLSTGKPGTFSDGIKYDSQDKFKQAIKAVKDRIEEKDWEKVAGALQTILDAKKDFSIEVTHTNPKTKSETTRRVSARFEANRIIGDLPSDGLDKYQSMFGGLAQERLEEGKKLSDPAVLAEVSLRFMHTKAGAEAADLLATYRLDKLEFFEAAASYKRLIALAERKEKPITLTPLTLFKATFAFKNAGDKKFTEKTWAMLEPKIRKSGLVVGDKKVTVAKLEEVLAGIKPPTIVGLKDWSMWRGDVARNALADASAPLLEAKWQYSTIHEELDEEKKKNTDTEGWVKIWIDAQNRKPDTTLSGFHPVAANGKLIYRNYNGLYAVYIKDGEDFAGKHKAGELAWKSDLEGGITSLLAEDKNNRQMLMNEWQPQFRQTMYHIFGENSMVGTLTTDHGRVYVVDDLAIPPHPSWLARFMYGGQPAYPGDLAKLVKENVLRAYDVESGKQVWEIPNRKTPGDMAESHFLGAPLPVGGKLYALNEKKGELRLLCIDPNKEGQIIRQQTLCTVNDQITRDIGRRMHSVNLAYGEGILVIPTNAGALLGVDLLTQSLIWSYPYREGQNTVVQPNPWGRPLPVRGGTLPSPDTEFKNSPPAIVNGKVVFASPDGQSIHCVDLREGTRDWYVKRSDDLYLAGVFGKKVLMVGKNGVRSLNLDTGRQMFAIGGLGMPTGQGVASKGLYYLPLKNKDKQGEVCVIDVEKGIVKAHNRFRKTNAELPGNLLFHDGAMLSQSATHVSAFPQLEVRIKEIDLALKGKPNDPYWLTERGELLLADGKVQAAVDDLRKVVNELKPADKDTINKARLKLYEGFTELFQKDFTAAAAEYLVEYKAMCQADDPAERNRREAKFLFLVGRGREVQGRLVEAYESYVAFAALPLNKDSVNDIDDPNHKARPDVWVRGRIAAMMAKSTSAQKKPLEQKIASEWKGVQSKNDIDAVRRFVNTFDVPFEVGRKARLTLADQLMEKNDKDSFIEAELVLKQLESATLDDDPKTMALTLEALARLAIRRAAADRTSTDAMQDAIRYYRILGERFPKTVIRDGKTGADYINDLATDKRFLPSLHETTGLKITGKMRAREVNPNELRTNANWWRFQNVYTLEPQGEDIPLFFQKNRLMFSANNRQFMWVDRSTGDEIWTVNLPNLVNAQYFYYFNNFNQSNLTPHPRLRYYQVKGHLAVIQVGPMVYALDVLNRKTLWEKNMLEGNPVNFNFSVQSDRDGMLEVVTYDQFTSQPYRRKVGMLGPVQAGYVCIQTQKGLVAVDPIKGTELWTKTDVPARTQLFGDNSHVFLVEVRDGTVVGGARCLRASDGVQVDVPDFGTHYQNRNRVYGRYLLTTDPGKEKMTLRLYDALTGKDIYKGQFDGKSILLGGEDNHVGGLIEPNGKVTLVDLRTQKEVLKSQIDEVDLKDVTTTNLLDDGEKYYIALNKPLVVNSYLYTNFANGTPWAMVNGMFYAFDRKGEVAWNAQVERQMLVLEQFKNLPIVLFTTRFYSQQGGWRYMAATKSIDKKTGKLLWDPDPKDYSGWQYYALNVDAKKRVINLLGGSFAIQHALDDGKPVKGGIKGGGATGTGTGGGGGYGRPVRPQPLPIRPIRGGIRRGVRLQAAPVQKIQIQLERNQ